MTSSEKNRNHRLSASLLIKGGHLIDPAVRIDAPMDVLLKHGRVAEVAVPGKIKGGADEKFDALGLVVAAGLLRCVPCPIPRRWSIRWSGSSGFESRNGARW
jgi:adenine deaminase